MKAMAPDFSAAPHSLPNALTGSCLHLARRGRGGIKGGNASKILLPKDDRTSSINRASYSTNTRVLVLIFGKHDCLDANMVQAG